MHLCILQHKKYRTQNNNLIFFVDSKCFREEMDAERLKDQEELRLQMIESKKRKFDKEEEQKRKREEEER